MQSHRHAALAQRANPRQPTAIGYPDSPLNAEGDALGAGPAPGEALAECPVRGPAGVSHLTDPVGPRWTAIVFADPDGALDAQLDAALAELERGPLPFRTAIVSARGEPGAQAGRVRVVDDVEVRADAEAGASGGLTRPAPCPAAAPACADGPR